MDRLPVVTITVHRFDSGSLRRLTRLGTIRRRPALRQLYVPQDASCASPRMAWRSFLLAKAAGTTYVLREDADGYRIELASSDKVPQDVKP